MMERLTVNPLAVPYRLAYRWWRNEARSSADPKTCLRYALNQLKLARAMDANPDFFRTKPEHQTDWQRFSSVGANPNV